MRKWKQTLSELTGDRRAGLIEYARVYTPDPAEAARAVDEALVAVLARGRGDAAAVEARARVEVRTIFGRRRHGGPRPAASAEEGGLSDVAPVDTDTATLAVRVRRRRLLRLSMVVAGAIGVLGLGAAAVYGVGQLTPVAPEPTPTPQPTPRPTPTPTPTVEPEPVILGPVTVDPLLPAALPLRAGMIEAAGPGWSLVQYANEAVEGGLVYLVSPAGELYEVPTPLADPDAGGGRLTDWLEGSTLVVLERWSAAGSDTDVVDILTGERFLTVHDHLSGQASTYYMSIGFLGDGSTDLILAFAENVHQSPSVVELTVRVGLDGRELATVPEFRGTDVSQTRWSLSPDGKLLALNEYGRLRVVRTSDFGEVSTLTSPYPSRPGDCAVERWAGPDQVLLTCWGGTKSEYGSWSHQEAWAAPVDGGRPTLLGSVEDWLAGWRVGDRTLILTYGDQGSAPWSFAAQLVGDDGTLKRLPGGVPEIITASAGGLLYGYQPPYDGPYWDHALVAVDPLTGSVVELLDAHADYDVIRAVVTHGDN